MNKVKNSICKLIIILISKTFFILLISSMFKLILVNLITPPFIFVYTLLFPFLFYLYYFLSISDMVIKQISFIIYSLAYLSFSYKPLRLQPSLLYVGALEYPYEDPLQEESKIFSIPYPASSPSQIPQQMVAISLFNLRFDESLSAMVQISQKTRSISSFSLQVKSTVLGLQRFSFTINYLVIDPKWDHLIATEQISFGNYGKLQLNSSIQIKIKQKISNGRQSKDLKVLSFLNSLQVQEGYLYQSILQTKVSINYIVFSINSNQDKEKLRETKFSIIYFYHLVSDEDLSLPFIFQPIITNLQIYPTLNIHGAYYFYGIVQFKNSLKTNLNSYIKSYQINHNNLFVDISAIVWFTLSPLLNMPLPSYKYKISLSQCPTRFLLSNLSYCFNQKQQSNRGLQKLYEKRVLQSCSYGYFLDTGVCRLCSERFFCCASCSSAECGICISGYGMASNRQSCFQCSVPNCLTCSVVQVCMGCISGYFLSYGSCNLCSVRFQNCATCNEALCITCQSSFVLAANFLSCVPRFTNSCTTANCVICTSIDQVCIGCANSFYLNSNNCLLCSNKFLNCQTCTGSKCVSCLPGFNLTINQNKCVNFSTTCQVTNCLDCPLSISVCFTCDQGYSLIQNICKPNCGDFYKTVDQACDDGNTLSGDGCSDICLVQNNFICEPAQLGSSCFYIGEIKIQKLYLKKISYKNQIEVRYTVFPANLTLWKYVNLSNLFIVQSVVPISQYSSILNTDGTISIFIDYSETIQGQIIDIFLNPSQSGLSVFSKFTQIRQQFVVLPSNNEIADFYSQQVYRIANLISILSIVVTGISYLFMLIGIVTGKMIGIELIGVIQVTFFSLLSLNQMNPCFAALSGLRYINGYNQLGADPMLDIYSSPPVKGVFLFSRFTQNLNITLIVIGVPLILSLIILFLSKTACQKREKLSKVGKKLLGQYTLTALMFCGYINSVSLGLQIMYGRLNQSDLIGKISIVECSIVSLLLFIYFILLLSKPELFGEYVKSFSKKKMVYRLYYNWMMLERLIVGSSIVFLLSSSISCIIPLLLFFLLSIFVLFFKPHNSNLHTYRVFGNYVISLIILILYLSYEKSGPSKSSQAFIYIPLIIVILLLLCSLYNSIAIIYFLVQYVKSAKIKAKDEEEFSEMARNERKMQRMRQQTGRHEQITPRLNQKGEGTNRNLRNIKKELKNFRHIDRYPNKYQINRDSYTNQDKEFIKSTRKRLNHNDSDQI